jgi:CBS domain-containing protein
MAKPKTVSEIMTRNVVTLFEEENLAQLRENLSRYHFHHLPVVDNGRLVGMLSQRDMMRATVAGLDGGAAAQSREHRFLEQTFVRDLMATKVITAAASDTIRDAAKRMMERRIGALPVVDADNKLIGIVTENDLVRTIADEP